MCHTHYQPPARVDRGNPPKHLRQESQIQQTQMSSSNEARFLTTETVEGSALSLQSVDNVEGGDGLALGVLGVGDGVTNNTLEEGLEDTSGLFVDHS